MTFKEDIIFGMVVHIILSGSSLKVKGHGHRTWRITFSAMGACCRARQHMVSKKADLYF